MNRNRKNQHTVIVSLKTVKASPLFQATFPCAQKIGVPKEAWAKILQEVAEYAANAVDFYATLQKEDIGMAFIWQEAPGANTNLFRGVSYFQDNIKNTYKDCPYKPHSYTIRGVYYPVSQKLIKAGGAK